MSMEHWWDKTDKAKPKCSEENLSQSHSVHQELCCDTRLPCVLVKQERKPTQHSALFYFSSSLGVTTSHIESFSLLNDISPSTTVLDAECPIHNLHFTDVLFNSVIPSALR
jgi:hypothetical protein